MATAITRGNISIRERPDSPEWDYNTQKITCTRTFEGMYADLLAAAPATGATMQGYNADLLVENVKIKRAVSGKATMTIVLENVSVSVTEPPPPVQPVYELEWTQLERPIEQNFTYYSLFNVPLTLQQIAANQTALQNWEALTDPTQKLAAFDALLTADSTGLLQQLAGAKMAGETVFLLFSPVARITTFSRAIAQVNPCGIISATVAGFPATLPAGYQWLSTSDRCTRTGTYGKWQRVQEWTGATYWDTRSYKSDGTVPSNTPSAGSS